MSRPLVSIQLCKSSLILEASVNLQKPGLKRSLMSLEILLGWVTVVIQLGEYYDWGSNLQVSSYNANSIANNSTNCRDCSRAYIVLLKVQPKYKAPIVELIVKFNIILLNSLNIKVKQI